MLGPIYEKVGIVWLILDASSWPIGLLWYQLQNQLKGGLNRVFVRFGLL